MAAKSSKGAEEAPPAAPNEDAATAVVDARGQMSVTLDGNDYVLRPSFEANQVIERSLRRSLSSLCISAENTQLTMDEMGVITAAYMNAYGKANPDDPLATDYKGAKGDRCAQLIFEAGSMSVCMKLYRVLTAAIMGGYDAAGEAKAL